jgi:hypothetical protein
VSKGAPKPPKGERPTNKGAPKPPKGERPTNGMNFYDLIAWVTTSDEQTKNFLHVVDRLEQMIDHMVNKFVRLIAASAVLVAVVSGVLVLVPSPPYAKAAGGAGLASVPVLIIAAWKQVRKWRKLLEPGGSGKS